LQTVNQAAPSRTTPAPPASGQRISPRPWIIRGQPIEAYSDAELLRLAQWIRSDDILRTGDELLQEMMRKLGFQRRGKNAAARLTAAITQPAANAPDHHRPPRRLQAEAAAQDESDSPRAEELDSKRSTASAKGRFEFGVGAGWIREEMANHGTDPRLRMAVMRERVEAMKAIWISDEASYKGKYVSFDRIWSWPKPPSAPIRRCSSAGTGRACWTWCCRSVTRGSPTTRPKASWSAPGNCAHTRPGRSR